MLAALLTAVAGLATGFVQIGRGNSTPAGASQTDTTDRSNGSMTQSTEAQAGPRSLLTWTPTEQHALSLPDYSHEVSTGPQTVDTIRRDRTMYMSRTRCAQMSRTYQLNRQYARFQAAVGLADDSESDGEVIFRVFADDKMLVEHWLKVGRTQLIDADVSGAFRMRIDTEVTCGFNGYATPVWVDPTVSRASTATSAPKA